MPQLAGEMKKSGDGFVVDDEYESLAGSVPTGVQKERVDE